MNAILAYNGTDRVTLGGDVGLVDLGNGNDVYNLRNHFATISDSNGIDTVTSTISRNLTGASNVERLTLLGATAINGDGNDLNNIIKSRTVVVLRKRPSGISLDMAHGKAFGPAMVRLLPLLSSTNGT